MVYFSNQHFRETECFYYIFMMQIHKAKQLQKQSLGVKLTNNIHDGSQGTPGRGEKSEIQDLPESNERVDSEPQHVTNVINHFHNIVIRPDGNETFRKTPFPTDGARSTCQNPPDAEGYVNGTGGASATANVAGDGIRTQGAGGSGGQRHPLGGTTIECSVVFNEQEPSSGRSRYPRELRLPITDAARPTAVNQETRGAGSKSQRSQNVVDTAIVTGANQQAPGNAGISPSALGRVSANYEEASMGHRALDIPPIAGGAHMIQGSEIHSQGEYNITDTGSAIDINNRPPVVAPIDSTDSAGATGIDEQMQYTGNRSVMNNYYCQQTSSSIERIGSTSDRGSQRGITGISSVPTRDSSYMRLQQLGRPQQVHDALSISLTASNIQQPPPAASPSTLSLHTVESMPGSMNDFPVHVSSSQRIDVQWVDDRPNLNLQELDPY